MIDLKGKTAFVTGAAGGIGLGISHALAKQGMHVVLADIDGVEAEKSAAELRTQGANALALRFDATDPASWAQAKEQAERALGPVRILCNNAGAFGGAGPIGSIDLATWRWLFAVNLDSQLYGLQTFLPAFLACDEAAHIVNTISMAGLFAAPQAGIYNATKYAALGLSMTLRHELAGTKVGISVLCPGYVATRLAQTSLSHQPDREADGASAAAQAFGAVLQQGMPPENVGPRVIDAIKSNEFYIFSHQSYRPVMEAVTREQLAAFGKPLDPEDRDDVKPMVALFQWNPNVTLAL